MNPEDYQKVKAVFQSVLEIAPKERSAYLDENCDNSTLRLEVEKLLNNFESGFMEETAIQQIIDVVEGKPFSAGDKIGRFEIISRLGKGGMGEVYLAHDKSLGRDVAIKVLLPEFSSDRERVNRFKLEAKAASALNHPNIITIYEVGEDDGKLFIATEHIIGETLRSLIQEKQIDLASSIRIAEQVASALTAAHQAGIIHRDIKPENVMVREDGFVKVLDFGLAKPTIVNPETETMDLVETKKGMIMGSVGYMSPEQARGKVVDARTDLWSIGVVFYEMLTSKTPFQGDTMTDILANIIHKEPLPISEQISEAPTELYRIVKKSLRKNADERYQTARDLSSDIKNLRREMELEHELELSVSPERLQKIKSRSNDLKKTADKENETQILSEPLETQTSVEITKVRSRYRTGILAAIGILIIGALSYFGYDYFKPKKLVDTAFKNSSVVTIPINGSLGSFGISPDGKYLVYVNETESNVKIMLRQLDSGSEKEIFSGEIQTILFRYFSPDGNYFYFETYSEKDNIAKLRRMPILGGDTKDIIIDTQAEISFSTDGKRMIFSRPVGNEEQIVISDFEGKNESVVFTSKEHYLMSPKLSPDGNFIIFFYGDKKETEGIGAKLGWMPSIGGEITPLGADTWDLSISGIRSLDVYAFYEWLEDGSGIIAANKLMFKEKGQIFRVSFPSGELTNVSNDNSNYQFLSATKDGNTIVSFKGTVFSSVWEYDLQTNLGKQITSTSNLANLTPQTIARGEFGITTTDTNTILMVKSDGKESHNLWQMNADGSNEKLLLRDKGRIETPIVSSDGKFIYFTTNTILKPPSFPTNAIWRMEIGGANLRQLTNPVGVIQQLVAVLPDNKSILFREWVNHYQDAKLSKLDIDTGQITPIFDDPNLRISRIDLSPSGNQLLYRAYTKVTSPGQDALFTHKIVDFDGTKIGNTRLNLPVDGSWRFRYGISDDFAYYFRWDQPEDIWRIDLKNAKSTKVTNFNHDQIFNFTVSRDGKKLYIVRGNTTDEVVLIKNVE